MVVVFSIFSLTRDVFAVDKLLEFSLILENHVYNPDILSVPYNKKVKIIIFNNDDSAEVFFSISLKRKKLVPGHSQAVIYIGPLKAGDYPFSGYNSRTATGIVRVVN